MFLRLLQTDELPRSELKEAAQQLQREFDGLEKVHDLALVEVDRWQAKLEKTRNQGFTGPDAEHNLEVFERERTLAGQIQVVLKETDQSIDDNQKQVASFLAKLETMTQAEATKALIDLVGKEFRARLSEVFVAQTQIRVFLIELPPVDLTVNQAIQVGLGNRLDLQNALALVTDNWRNVEVDANQLRGFLNFVYNGTFNTAPNHDTLFRFDANSSVQTFGLQFDAPINRRAERNQYRADQINYQRARRAYMLSRDTVVQEIRFDMRQLALARRTFEINREQIITSSRQLEEAEYVLRTSTDTQAPVTLNLLTALTNVLSARNTLIQTWVLYETARMSLYRDFDLMDIDANGVWTNENDPTAVQIALRHAQSAPALSLAIPARIPDLSPGIGSESTFYTDIEPGGRPGRVPDRLDETEGPIRTRELETRPVGPGGNPPARGGPGIPPSPAPGPPRTPSPFTNDRPAS
jgi:hypothetical protein